MEYNGVGYKGGTMYLTAREREMVNELIDKYIYNKDFKEPTEEEQKLILQVQKKVWS